MSAKRAALLTVAILFTMVVAAASINASGADSDYVAADGYGISSFHKK